MVSKIEVWQDSVGNNFNTEKEAKESEAKIKSSKSVVYECPKCEGLGRFTDKTKPIMEPQIDYHATGCQGAYAPPVYKDVIVSYEQTECNVCEAMGWTKVPMVPVYETQLILVGYQTDSTKINNPESR